VDKGRKADLALQATARRITGAGTFVMIARAAGALLTQAGFALALSACAAGPVRMAQPEGLGRDAAFYPIRGVWSGDTGYFAVAGHVGGFTRGAKALTEIGFLDLRSASAAFDIVGPELPGAIDAICDAEDDATAGPEPDDEKSVLCEFDLDGSPTDWALELDPAPDDPKLRRGVITLDAATLSLRSTNAAAPDGRASRMTTGYVLEGEGGVVGTVELTVEPPLLRVSASAGPAERRAALVAAAALAVLAGPHAAPADG
jgi:hypothetical protein